nr:hypothetical protein [Tanacetum cinerariifolium]
MNFLIRKKRALLKYLEELDKLIDERVIKHGELQMKEKEAHTIKEIKKRLEESNLLQQESLVTEGTTLEANLSTNDLVMEACFITEGAVMEAILVTEGATLEASLVNEGITLNDITGVTKSSGTESENSSIETPFSRSEDENRSFDKESTVQKAKKHLKAKQRKSPLSYHGSVYAETQFEELPKVYLKRRNVNLTKHLEQAHLREHDLKL